MDDTDDLNSGDDVDEDRLEALALRFDLVAKTDYEPRGPVWCCYIVASGPKGALPKSYGIDKSTKQKAFDKAMDDLTAYVRRYYGVNLPDHH